MPLVEGALDGAPLAREPITREVATVDELGRRVDRWVERGIIRRDQADAILAMETDGDPPGRRSAVVETLGYVGGTLALVAAVRIGAESWADLGRGGRLVVLAAATAGLFGAGWRLRAGQGRALPRLASVLWMASVGAFAGLLAVLLTGRGDAFAADHPLIPVAAGSLAYAGVLWHLERRALQQVALAATAAITVVALADRVGASAGLAAGLGLLALGAAWLELGRRGLLRPRRTAEALGVLGLVAGPETIWAGETDWALLLGLAVALGLVALGSLAGRTVLLGLGAAALFLFLVEVAATWWRSLGAPLAVLLVGLGLMTAAVALSKLRPATRPPAP